MGKFMETATYCLRASGSGLLIVSVDENSNCPEAEVLNHEPDTPNPENEIQAQKHNS